MPRWPLPARWPGLHFLPARPWYGLVEGPHCDEAGIELTFAHAGQVFLDAPSLGDVTGAFIR